MTELKNAPGEIRTPNHLIRSQVLYPLSYEGRQAILYLKQHVLLQN